jgi:hypothetical protein
MVFYYHLTGEEMPALDVTCFFDPQETAALPRVKTKPDCECLTAQSASENISSACAHCEYRSPTSLYAGATGMRVPSIRQPP